MAAEDAPGLYGQMDWVIVPLEWSSFWATEIEMGHSFVTTADIQEEPSGMPSELPKYYYCQTCHKDMCALCFVEKTEEIAVANGAKNWGKRKDALTLARR